MTEMKYLRIFENALRRLGLSKKDVKDWKPAGDTYKNIAIFIKSIFQKKKNKVT